MKQQKAELDAIRRNPALLENYRFDHTAPDSKQEDRLRLNVGIYNDLQASDFEIATFLFREETQWRKYASEKEGDVDHWYFSAFVLSLFHKPEVLWLFLDAKNTDFDSSIGFDGAYLLASGIRETYHYLDQTDHPQKPELFRYIGETEGTCTYSQEEIEEWKENKKAYFRDYERID